MSRKMKIGLPVLAVGLMLGVFTPAQASKVVEIEFIGKAKLSAPVGAPGLGINKGEDIPFEFQAGNDMKKDDKENLCVVSEKVTGPDKDKDKATVETNIPCGILANGVVGVAVADPAGPWCGHSGGDFAGRIVIKKASGDKIINFDGAYTNQGGLQFSGSADSGSQTGSFAGGGAALPWVTQGQSCLSGADKFIVSGTVKVVLT